MSRGRITQIVNITNFGKINNLLSQGHDMDYIARHYNMDPPPPLAWALRLEGKTDQEKFRELGWGIRTWDQWNFVSRSHAPAWECRRFESRHITVYSIALSNKVHVVFKDDEGIKFHSIMGQKTQGV